MLTVKKILKSIYLYLPFKQHLYKVVRFLFVLPHSIYQHLYFRGKFSVKVNDKHQFTLLHFGAKIENEIFWKGLYGNWEKESLKIWARACEYSNVVVDVGANSGIYALIAKTVRNSSKVYAFEPVERVFNRLNDNISLNNYDINSFQIGLSNYDGVATIYDPGGDHLYSVTVNKNIHVPDIECREVLITVNRLDTWYYKNISDPIDLVKIDVETHEPQVLEGFGEILSHQKPSLLVEVLNDDTASHLNNIFNGLGYLFFYIDESIGLIRKEKIERCRFYNYFLCQKAMAYKLDLINE